MSKQLKLNYLAVITCIVVGQVIPATWYGLFAEPWMKYNNLTLEYINENASTIPYLVSIISSAIAAFALAWLFTKLNVQSAVEGLKYALIISIAFNFFVLYTQNWFSFRSPYLALIDGGVYVVVFSVYGLILGGWRKYMGT